MKAEPIELSIVLLAASHNPTVLNPDFLRDNRIVPEAFDADGNVVTSDAFSQVAYEQQGIAIASQRDRVLFTQFLASLDFSDATITAIASEYVTTLPHVNYLAVGLNPKVFVEFPSRSAASEFMTSNIIAPGPWKDVDGAPAMAKLALTYVLPECQLTLNVEPRGITVEGDGQGMRHGISIAGNFHRDLSDKGPRARSEAAKGILERWGADINMFMRLVKEFILEPAS